MTSADSPRTEPAAPWIQASDVMAVPVLADEDVSVEVAQQMAAVASDILYNATKRVYTGVTGPVTVRPLMRPTDVDTRFGHRGIPQGYLSAGQAATAYGMPGGGVNYFGSNKPAEVDLGAFPVIEVTEVKIDGMVIPPNEYYLQDRRTLVRALPSVGSTPTERWGWPMTQRLDLPDTEEGTFSVTYTYGVAPPPAGVLAATTLAVQLTLNYLGQDNSLPQRTVSISRQGVSVQVASVVDLLKAGMTGIYEVDVFVEAVNPNRSRLPSLVWSPDLGRPRRMPPSVI